MGAAVEGANGWVFGAEAAVVAGRVESSFSHPARAPTARLVSSGRIERSEEEIFISVSEQGEKNWAWDFSPKPSCAER